MSDVQGKLEIQGSQDNLTRIELNGDSGAVTAGGDGQNGDLLLRDGQKKERVRLGVIKESGLVQAGSRTPPPVIAQYWGLRIKNASGTNLVQIGRVPSAAVAAGRSISSTVSVILGADGHAGILELKDADGHTRSRLGLSNDGTERQLEIRNANNTETIYVRGGQVELESNNKVVMRLEAQSATAWIGGNDQPGNIFLFPDSGNNATKPTVHIDGQAGKVLLGKVSTGEKRKIELDGATGQVMLRSSNKDRIHLDGATAHVKLRSSDGEDRIFLDGENGYIELKDEDDKTKMRLYGSHGHAWLGGDGIGGLVAVFSSDQANVTEGAKASILLDGDAGDIVLRNADCAEEFDIATDATAVPGTVMVIDDEGKMRPSSTAYDRRVAGVVSGAGTLKPGIVLGRQPNSSTRLPIALTGKVYCRVDASSAPIQTGDLLTTSAVPGCAMKVVEAAQAFGAVIGKALMPLNQGHGLIPILVALQ